MHTETGNIYYENLNTNKSIYNLLQERQDKTKNIYHCHTHFHYSFSNYIKEFLDDLDFSTIDTFHMLANKNIKYMFYRYNDFCCQKSHQQYFEGIQN